MASKRRQLIPDNWFDQEKIPPTPQSMPVSSRVYKVTVVVTDDGDIFGDFYPGLLNRVQLLISAIRGMIRGIPNLKLPTTPVEIIALILLIGIMAGFCKTFDYVFNSVDKKVTTEIDSARKGQEGEEAVIDTLRQNLDGNWILFRNLTLPGKNKADMDAVLVGPPGVWVLEIKNFTGEYCNFGEHWEIQVGNRRKPLKKSPSR